MSPRYIIMKEPRRNRHPQTAQPEALADASSAEQPVQAMAEWTGNAMEQQSAAEAFMQTSETPSME
jgi:hypothetical protein